MNKVISTPGCGVKPQLGIYIHIPFCIRKCLYCDFLSAPADDISIQLYVDALLTEIRMQAHLYKKYEVGSVFLGGGTPSVLKPEQIHKLMETVKLQFCFMGNAEISMEVNPGTATYQTLSSYRQAGINRLSIGLQSVHDRELRELGRIHTYGDFMQIWEDSGAAGFRDRNIDLMSALPGQTPDDWRDCLEKVTVLGPTHISAYSLIIEEGTPFYDRYGEAVRPEESGFPALPAEEEDRMMYAYTKECLMRAGYHRYEISNYARPGCECRHNEGYWQRRDYVGFGLGAASLINNERWSNTSKLSDYLKLCRTPDQFKENRQKLSAQEQMEEFMFLGLRLTAGVREEEFHRLFGTSMQEIYGEVLADCERDGVLQKTPDAGGYRLTDYGIDVSNVVLARFLL